MKLNITYYKEMDSLVELMCKVLLLVNALDHGKMLEICWLAQQEFKFHKTDWVMAGH